MRIVSIASAIPSRKVVNDELLEIIRQRSKPAYDGDLDVDLEFVNTLLKRSGAISRYWLNENETPLQLIKQAATEAIEEADINADDIDLLIYVGIGKGFLEPGQSYFVAKDLGLKRVQCFDLLDACMSWSRALNIAEKLLADGSYKNILVINGEINTYENGPLFPQNLSLKSKQQIEWTFPSYTIGSAATATLLARDDSNKWRWEFESRPEFADLCTIPSHQSHLFTGPSDNIGKNGSFAFTSYGLDLHREATSVFLKMQSDNRLQLDNVKYIFPHASSKRAWDVLNPFLPENTAFYHIYPEYGNVVSASVPAAISLALKEDKLQRGDTLAGMVGSAGMSFAFYRFEY